MCYVQRKSSLEALQCHFTWDLDEGKSKLYSLRDQLWNSEMEERKHWQGHFYNLLGYVQCKLGCTQDAPRWFGLAQEAFRKIRKADEGPWLVVHYGNLAWLHHLLGDQGKSQDYLSKVDALMQKYPSPSQHELHAETYAEKAWTLMKFSRDKQLLAVDYFEKAIGMQPEMVEWNSSYVLAVVNAFKHHTTGLEDDILEKMRIAKEDDRENLYLAAQYLKQRAKRGERIDKDEVRKLGGRLLKDPVSSCNVMHEVMWLYREHVSVDEAVNFAEEILKRNPDEFYLKRCAALFFKWVTCRDNCPDQRRVKRAISLHEEAIDRYPDSSLVNKIDLANIYAKKDQGQAKAEQMYQDLLKMDLEPADKQMLYHHYAVYLNFDQQDSKNSITYHMKVAEIPQKSFFRDESVRILEEIKDRNWNFMCKKIGRCLDNLPKLQH